MGHMVLKKFDHMITMKTQGKGILKQAIKSVGSIASEFRPNTYRIKKNKPLISTPTLFISTWSKNICCCSYHSNWNSFIEAAKLSG